jgi:hypothetical protein
MTIVIPFTKRWYAQREEETARFLAEQMAIVRRVDSFKKDFIYFLGEARDNGLGAARLDVDQEKILELMLKDEKKEDFDYFEAEYNRGHSHFVYKNFGTFEHEERAINYLAMMGIQWSVEENSPLYSVVSGALVRGLNRAGVDNIAFRFFQSPKFVYREEFDRGKRTTFKSDGRVDFEVSDEKTERWNIIGSFKPQIYPGQDIYVYAHNTGTNIAEDRVLFGGARTV